MFSDYGSNMVFECFGMGPWDYHNGGSRSSVLDHLDDYAQVHYEASANQGYL